MPADRFEAEANAGTREFPARFDPAAQTGDAGTQTAIGNEPGTPVTDADPAVVGNDPSVTAEAEIVKRDARDQADPRKGPRSLMKPG